MDTKEAKECLETIYDEERDLEGNFIPNYNLANVMPEIIKLLQRGEKFEQMWRNFKEEYSSCYLLDRDYEHIEDTLYEPLTANMFLFEQKYFLKEPKKPNIPYSLK